MVIITVIMVSNRGRERPDAGRVRPEPDRTSGPVRQATSVKARTGPERPAGSSGRMTSGTSGPSHQE